MFQKIALSIGNDAYDRNRLGACVNDATDVGLSLKSIGFQVLLKTNMDARTTNMITNRFIQAIQPGSIALLYFSGHGLQFKGNNYLVATDNNDLGLDNLEEMAFNVQRVVDAMYRRRPRLILVILDCCRSYWHVEPPEKGRLSKIRSSRYKDGLAPMQAPPATIIAFACAADTVSSALSINDRNSLYTYHLLNHIRTPNVDIDTVLKNVAIDVRRDPVNMEHQVPFRYSSCNEFIYLSNNGAMDMSMPYGSYQPGFPYKPSRKPHAKSSVNYSQHRVNPSNNFHLANKISIPIMNRFYAQPRPPFPGQLHYRW